MKRVRLPTRSTLMEERGTAVDIDRMGLEQILPHRAPFLLLDGVAQIDLAQRALEARRHIDVADPVFDGHFPSDPVYPGVLLLEMIGQAGLALAHFIRAERTELLPGDAPRSLRLARIEGAQFLEEVRPGDDVRLVVKMTEDDGWIGTCIGQAIVDGKICTAAACQVVWLDD